MANALILYGSRARGENRANSDTDLMLATDGEKNGEPVEHHGVSVGRISKAWLEREARAGSLFAYHIGYEGFALDDPDKFLTQLQHAFQRKSSYADDARVAALVLRMLLEQNRDLNVQARRRFFWALRTVLICTVADNGPIAFSSAALEREADIPGLAALIEQRETVSSDEYREYGRHILAKLTPDLDPQLKGERLLAFLTAHSGIARDSVRMIQENETAGAVTQMNR